MSVIAEDDTSQNYMIIGLPLNSLLNQCIIAHFHTRMMEIIARNDLYRDIFLNDYLSFKQGMR